MKDGKIISTFLICASILATGFLLTKNHFVVNTTTGGDHTISVNGVGQVHVTPDVLFLHFNVSENGSSTEKVQEKVNEKVLKIKEIAAKYNVDESDIKTTNMNVYPQYDWTQSGRVFKGYSASHSIEIKIKKANDENSDIGGKVIKEVSMIGGVELNSISYDIEDKSGYYSEARRLALEKAEQKAQDLAKFAGVKLGKAVSISESQTMDYGVLRQNTKNMSLDSSYGDELESIDISMGKSDLTLNVSVVYELK